MKALVVDAMWAPRKDYSVTEEENINSRALCGSQVWKDPRFEIKEVPTPDIDDDEVLIRVKACGICGSDIHLFETDKEGYIIFSGLVKLPCILGHEFSGIVEKVGKRVASLKRGDAVAVESILWCGICTSCRGGSLNQCKNVELAGLSSNGALAEFIGVKEKYCWNLNTLREVYEEQKVFEAGALIEPAGCAYNGMFVNEGGLMPGETFVVYGVGSIGLAAVALARTAGASKINAFDKIPERLALAKKMGADFVFNVNNCHDKKSPAHRIVLELTEDEGADIHESGIIGLTPFMWILCLDKIDIADLFFNMDAVPYAEIEKIAADKDFPIDEYFFKLIFLYIDDYSKLDTIINLVSNKFQAYFIKTLKNALLNNQEIIFKKMVDYENHVNSRLENVNFHYK